MLFEVPPQPKQSEHITGVSWLWVEEACLHEELPSQEGPLLQPSRHGGQGAVCAGSLRSGGGPGSLEVKQVPHRRQGGPAPGR